MSMIRCICMVCLVLNEHVGSIDLFVLWGKCTVGVPFGGMLNNGLQLVEMLIKNIEKSFEAYLDVFVQRTTFDGV